MLLARRDRREWAVLGLVLLAWGLLVAPLVHRESHAHGHRHSHGPTQPSSPHGAASLEHQALSFVEGPATPTPIFLASLLVVRPELVPQTPERRVHRRVEQSQAP
ncbi:MAG: hypothetical protein ACOZQL_04705 [Myxococcota bacterium]